MDFQVGKDQKLIINLVWPNIIFTPHYSRYTPLQIYIPRSRSLQIYVPHSRYIYIYTPLEIIIIIIIAILLQIYPTRDITGAGYIRISGAGYDYLEWGIIYLERVIYNYTVKPVLSDHPWAKKKRWYLNRGGL